MNILQHTDTGEQNIPATRAHAESLHCHEGKPAQACGSELNVSSEEEGALGRVWGGPPRHALVSVNSVLTVELPTATRLRWRMSCCASCVSSLRKVLII